MPSLINVMQGDRVDFLILHFLLF